MAVGGAVGAAMQAGVQVHFEAAKAAEEVQVMAGVVPAASRQGGPGEEQVVRVGRRHGVVHPQEVHT